MGDGGVEKRAPKVSENLRQSDQFSLKEYQPYVLATFQLMKAIIQAYKNQVQFIERALRYQSESMGLSSGSIFTSESSCELLSESRLTSVASTKN